MSAESVTSAGRSPALASLASTCTSADTLAGAWFPADFSFCKNLPGQQTLQLSLPFTLANAVMKLRTQELLQRRHQAG